MMWFSASLRQDVKYKSNMHVKLFKKKANAILKDSCVFHFCFQYVLQQ